MIQEVLNKGFENSEKTLITIIMDNLKHISDKPSELKCVNKRKSPRIRKGRKREKVSHLREKKLDAFEYHAESTDIWNEKECSPSPTKSDSIKIFRMRGSKKPHKPRHLDLRHLAL